MRGLISTSGANLRAVSIQPVDGFFDDLLGFGQKVVGSITEYKNTQAQSQLSLAQQRAAIEQQRLLAAEQASAKEGNKKFYIIGGVVVALGALYFINRRRR